MLILHIILKKRISLLLDDDIKSETVSYADVF
jgi:hypothetical protein